MVPPQSAPPPPPPPPPLPLFHPTHPTHPPTHRTHTHTHTHPPTIPPPCSPHRWCPTLRSTFRMFCTMIILIETIDVSDMISSSALIYRPDILNNPNVSYFY